MTFATIAAPVGVATKLAGPVDGYFTITIVGSGISNLAYAATEADLTPDPGTDVATGNWVWPDVSGPQVFHLSEGESLWASAINTVVNAGVIVEST